MGAAPEWKRLQELLAGENVQLKGTASCSSSVVEGSYQLLVPTVEVVFSVTVEPGK